MSLVRGFLLIFASMMRSLETELFMVRIMVRVMIRVRDRIRLSIRGRVKVRVRVRYLHLYPYSFSLSLSLPILGDIVAVELLPRSDWMAIVQQQTKGKEGREGTEKKEGKEGKEGKEADLNILQVDDNLTSTLDCDNQKSSRSSSNVQKEVQKEVQKGVRKELWLPRDYSLLKKDERDVKEKDKELTSVASEINEYCQKSGLQPRGKIIMIVKSDHLKTHVS
jgi:hypothetical protein